MVNPLVSNDGLCHASPMQRRALVHRFFQFSVGIFCAALISPAQPQPSANTASLEDATTATSPPTGLFPIASSGAGKKKASVGENASTDSEQAAPPLPLRATNIAATPLVKIRWLLFQSSERSANTGQLTCLGWARSINLAKALENEGPFNAAIASASVLEDLTTGMYWNNAAEATLTPLASKWDVPVWSQSPADAPMEALSALYQFSKKTVGSVNIAVAWDGEYLERFQGAWLEGLVKSGDMDGLQAFSWKQKIRKWTAKDTFRVDVLEYTVEKNKIKNVQWRTMNLRTSAPNYGCPTS